MAITSVIKIEKEIIDLIDKKLTEEVSKEFDKKIEELIKRKDEIVCGLILNIKKQIDIQSMNENIIITLRKDK